MPHLVIGWCLVLTEWRCDDADWEFRKALELDPQWDRGHHGYAEFLRAWGRKDEATAELKRGLALNPRSVRLNQRLAKFLLDARRYREAIESEEYFMRMEPSVSHYWVRIDAHCALGEYDKAIAVERNQLLSRGESSKEADLRVRELKKSFTEDSVRGYWRSKLDWMQKHDYPPAGKERIPLVAA